MTDHGRSLQAGFMGGEQPRISALGHRNQRRLKQIDVAMYASTAALSDWEDGE